jgi:ABC-2 type transport system permease protein
MNRLFRFFIRSSTFLRKEFVQILRQPRLILIIILGPFLIMLLFGLAYRRETRSLRTLFVVQLNSPLTSQVQKYGKTLGPAIIYEGIVHNKQIALNKLDHNQVDLVVVVPPHPLQTIQNNHQAVLQLYDNEVDPYQIGYVKYIGNLYVEALNRRILYSVIQHDQSKTGTLQNNLQAAQKSAQAYQQALAQHNFSKVTSQKQNLNQNLDSLRILLGTGLGIYRGMQGAQSTSPNSNNLGNFQDILKIMNAIEQNRKQINSSSATGGNTTQKEQQAASLEKNLSKLNTALGDFRKANPVVLVNPFTSETHDLSKATLTPTGYYTPAVIVLLLQHLIVTFAGLSIVHERRAGTMELFRASPISAFEVLLGKYVSYLAVGIIAAVLITALSIWILGVPMLGTWLDYSATVIVILFTSLSAGFLISLVSANDTQSVQYGMLLLLASIFFSGFFLNLNQMWPPMRKFAFILPATYAIHILHEVMLRGHPIPLLYIIGITGIGLILVFLDWYILHRKMSLS